MLFFLGAFLYFLSPLKFISTSKLSFTVVKSLENCFISTSSQLSLWGEVGESGGKGGKGREMEDDYI